MTVRMQCQQTLSRIFNWLHILIGSSCLMHLKAKSSEPIHEADMHLSALFFFIVLVPINLKRLWFRSSTINSGGAYGQLSLIAARWQCNRLCLPLLRKGWRLEALQGKDHFFFVHLSHMGSITQVQAIHTAAYLAKFPSWLLKRNISDVSGLGCVIQYCGT